ncbi:hypothetical protein As57867_017196, partial [Aphanomyces stellatus]
MKIAVVLAAASTAVYAKVTVGVLRALEAGSTTGVTVVLSPPDFNALPESAGSDRREAVNAALVANLKISNTESTSVLDSDKCKAHPIASTFLCDG